MRRERRIKGECGGVNTPSCIIPPPPPFPIFPVFVFPHTTWTQFRTPLRHVSLGMLSAVSLKYFHCSSCIIIISVVLGGKIHYFGGKIRIGFWSPPICDFICEKIILSHYMIQIPLRNLFNFEVPFSVGYDKDGRVSIESLFKCHQGFTPISRQQAHSRHHLRPASNRPYCATFLVWGLAFILARSVYSHSWLLLIQTTWDAATLIRTHFYESSDLGPNYGIWGGMGGFLKRSPCFQ